jgi:hypothetical protein
MYFDKERGLQLKKQHVALAFLFLLQITILYRLSVFQAAAQNEETQSFDPSQIVPIYSNVEIVGLEQHSMWVGVIFTGFNKQEVFAAIFSPWKPIVITSNDTLQPFTELEYDPLTMSENPIVEATVDCAWDYDYENNIVSLKLVLTSADTVAVVRVAIYYVVSANIISFSSDKLNYSVYDPVNVSVTVSAQYVTNATANWLVEVLIIQNSTRKLFQEARKEIVLKVDEKKDLHYDFVPITVAGTYVAIARVSDPSNGNVVAYSQFMFHVWTPSPDQGEIVVPEWVKEALLSIFVIAVSVLVYAKFKDKILKAIKWRPKPS